MDSHRAIESLADVQRLLLPDNPQIRGLHYAFHYQPAAIAAGDYYDLMPLNDGVPADFLAAAGVDAWGVILADVSGHGAAAAMEAAQFDAILRTYRGDEPPGGPGGALTYANRHFFSRRPRRHFLTVFAALYRPDLGTLTYCSAGHHPALLRRGNDVFMLGEDGDIPLGIDRGAQFRNQTFAVQPGDTLLLCTDGVLEALDVHGRAFGIERLQAMLAEGATDCATLRDQLVAALHAHQGDAVGVDDQTLLMLRVAPLD